MADVPYYLHSLSLTGFRAYLHPKTFDFRRKRCLAIFAPNGNGKSSMVDALEFMFSGDGTLARLGTRAANNNAGVAALAHNLAEEAKIKPGVSIEVKAGKEVRYGIRDAAGAKRPIPEIATTLNGCFSVNPIIRGHALRAFVENHTLEDRYASVAGWLQLEPLVDVQRSLRQLRMQVNQATADETEARRIDSQLAKETGQTIKAWDTVAVLEYINTIVLTPLDRALTLAALAPADRGYGEVEARAKIEETKVGLASLRQLRSAARTLWAPSSDPSSPGSPPVGSIPAFEAAVASLMAAIDAESTERGKAASAAFTDIWRAAEPFFRKGGQVPEACPICTTPITTTSAGTADAIHEHIARHLAELSDYAAAKRRLDDARTSASKAHVHVVAGLPGLAALLGDTEPPLKDNLEAYRAAVSGWQHGNAPQSESLVKAIADLLVSVERQIVEIEAKQGEYTYAKAKAKIERLVELHGERETMIGEREELEKLSDGLTAMATTTSGEIRQKVQSLLNRLQAPINDIYCRIQGENAALIRLELPPEDDANQQRLHLLVDFAKNRTGVAPSGYLSDSQVHSVALALRLAAIKQFNGAAPIIVLDDIVTSYDADHRRRIAGLLAEMFDEHQILITAHDEMFFNCLIDQLEPKTWHFTRIKGLDLTYGPRFADHKVTDELIEARWNEGGSAANEMRQAEEEWLLRICREFGVSVRIRPLEKAYSYERSELASALAGFLKGAGLEPALVPGVNNRFLGSLQKGLIENFGSHFQDGPFGQNSIGDEKARWEEFKAFRNQFSCRKCTRVRFQRPHALKRPICAHEDCETQFEFSSR